MSRFAPLFADPRLLKFQDSFRAREPTVDPGQVLIGIAVLTIAIIVLYFASRAMERRARRGHFDSSLGLFLSLAKAHNLGWSDRWLLWRLARCRQLKEPARLFLEPERFDSSNLTDSLLAKHNRLKLISGRIFAESTENPGQTGPGSKTAKESSAPLPERPCPLSFPIDGNPALDVPLWPTDPDPADGFSINSLFEEDASSS
jgi:hypothetical protein